VVPEITTHFSSPPFQYQALEHSNVHKILSSYDVLGGQATFNVLYTTQKFHDENPKTYKAFYRAGEAANIINADKNAAAETYIRVEKSRLPLALVQKLLMTRKSVLPFRLNVRAYTPKNSTSWAC
jgi:NitT/TauT family transport system substrate-binding protein